MNRTTFITRAAVAAIATMVLAAMLGCATVPEPATTVSDAERAASRDGVPVAGETPDVTFGPLSAPDDTVAVHTDEVPVAWIDDTIARREPAPAPVTAARREAELRLAEPTTAVRTAHDADGPAESPAPEAPRSARATQPSGTVPAAHTPSSAATEPLAEPVPPAPAPAASVPPAPGLAASPPPAPAPAASAPRSDAVTAVLERLAANAVHANPAAGPGAWYPESSRTADSTAGAATAGSVAVNGVADRAAMPGDPAPEARPGVPASSGADRGSSIAGATPSLPAPETTPGVPAVSGADRGRSIAGATPSLPAPEATPGVPAASGADRGRSSAGAALVDAAASNPAEPAPARSADAAADAGPSRELEGAPPRAATVWNDRASEVAAGSEIRVVLPGSGWLYVGREYGDGRVSLLEKRTEGGDDVFRFRMEEEGDYGLWFQQQDATSGSLVNERLALRAAESGAATEVRLAELPEGGTLVVDDGQGGGATPTATRSGARESASATGLDAVASDREIAGRPPEADGASARPEALQVAVGLLDAGDGVASLRALVDALATGDISVDELDGALLDRYAAVARRSADLPDAPTPVLRAFWREVASSGSAAAPAARRALLELALRSADAESVTDSLATLEAAGEASAEDLARAADTLIRAERDASALPLLARALSSDASLMDDVSGFDDERLYRLARLLEAPGPERDLRRAASIYRLIVDERPLSAYWDASRERAEHLRRHYFEIR